MNFVFVVDTSISMLQQFDKEYNYLDTAKNAIEVFIKKRETLKNKNRPDKYFLLTTEVLSNGQSNIISSWTDPTEHFMFQLKCLKIEYSFTDLETCLKTSLEMLNYLKTTGVEKHVHGRLPKQNTTSYIMLFTDGGKINNAKKVMGKNSRINLMYDSSSLDRTLYYDPFKWDQFLLAYVLNPAQSETAKVLINKYKNLIGGAINYYDNFNQLMGNIEDFAINKFNTGKFKVIFEINNTMINNINQNEKSHQENTIKFVSRHKQNKELITLNIGAKQGKGETDTTLNRELWPLPDDFLVYKSLKQLPKRKAHPTYTIGSEVNFDFNTNKDDYDEYLVEDKNYLINFLSNYPGLTLRYVRSLLISDVEAKKITWDVYNIIQNSDLIPRKPFAVLKLVINHRISTLTNNTVTHEDISLSELIQENDNFRSHMKLKFCVLPYNYKEFFNILKNSGSSNKNEFVMKVEKYMDKIPFYYKPYVVIYLEKKGLWKRQENFYNSLDQQNLDELVLTQINHLIQVENDRMAEVNKLYNKNKQLHLSKNAQCCGLHVFRQKAVFWSDVNTGKADSQLSNFLNTCSDLNSFSKRRLAYNQISSEKIEAEIEIEHQGDYKEYLIKFRALRNPYLFENEIKEFRGDYFGNPFRRFKIDFDNTDLEDIVKLDNPNINISDGERLFVNEKSKEVDHTQPAREVEDDELLVYPGIRKKRERGISVSYSSASTSNLSNNESTKFQDDLSQYSVPFQKKNEITKNKLNIQMVEDDLIDEFKELFNKHNSNYSNYGLKIKKKFPMEIEKLHRWKMIEKLKECKFSFKIL